MKTFVFGVEPQPPSALTNISVSGRRNGVAASQNPLQASEESIWVHRSGSNRSLSKLALESAHAEEKK